VQVGKFPEDFDCYRRAENIPDGTEECPESARATLLANVSYPASDAASYASAGLSAAAALLQDDDPAFAQVRAFGVASAVVGARCCVRVGRCVFLFQACIWQKGRAPRAPQRERLRRYVHRSVRVAAQPQHAAASSHVIVHVDKSARFQTRRAALSMNRPHARVPARFLELLVSAHALHIAMHQCAPADTPVMAVCLCAQDCLTSAHALYDFANRYNGTGMLWAPGDIGESYPIKSPDQTNMFAEAMFGYVYSCEDQTRLTCNQTQAQLWTDLAIRNWGWRTVRCNRLFLDAPLRWAGVVC
jgi:hypothetical protein